MNTNLVSVGLPVYNGEKYVGKAIESVLNQTHTNLELIISDNGSTDQTPDIMRSYAKADPRIRLLFRSAEESQQQSANTNSHGYVSNASKNFAKVLLHARGPFFCWHAHDNFWDVDFLSQCLLHIGDGAGAMGGAAGFDLLSGRMNPFAGMPVISYKENRLEQVRKYVNGRNHGSCAAVYGLFRTADLAKVALPILRSRFFDWSDVYLVASVIPRGGITIFNPERPLLFLGFEGAYVEKPANGVSVGDRELRLRIILMKLKLILQSPRNAKSALLNSPRTLKSFLLALSNWFSRLIGARQA